MNLFVYWHVVLQKLLVVITNMIVSMYQYNFRKYTFGMKSIVFL